MDPEDPEWVLVAQEDLEVRAWVDQEHLEWVLEILEWLDLEVELEEEVLDLEKLALQDLEVQAWEDLEVLEPVFQDKLEVLPFHHHLALIHHLLITT